MKLLFCGISLPNSFPCDTSASLLAPLQQVLGRDCRPIEPQTHWKVEALEHAYPLMVERYARVPDSGGPGKWRGGLGIHRQIKVMATETDYAYNGTRLRVPSWELCGGKPGGCGALLVHRHGGASPVRESLLRPGESLSVITPGAGGYGDPRERSRELVL